MKQILSILIIIVSGMSARAEIFRLESGTEIRQLKPGVFMHTSMNEQGISSNGLLLEIEGGALLVDTSWDDPKTEELVRWSQDERERPVVRAIVTHSHSDRMGGIDALHRLGIEVSSLDLTVRAARQAGDTPPSFLFRAEDKLYRAPSGIEVFYPGPGHTVDNIVVYLPKSRILFGGCFIKSKDSRSLGYIREADLESWPASLRAVEKRYGETEIVVPGHGQPSDLGAIHNTLQLLFKREKNPPQNEGKLELSHHFEAFEVEGAFLLYDAANRAHLSYNNERGRMGFPPASTFKILNSLIALETGVIENEHVILPWDDAKRRVESWNRDHDLTSAFRNSALWYYQELARRIGKERMRSFVERVGYGNLDIGGRLDLFWLEGKLRISAYEQIDFLRKLERGDLPFSERAMKIVRRIMEIEEGEGYVLRGKTGWALHPNGHHGWYVGWIEKGGDRFFFALQVSSTKKNFPMFEARPLILRGILNDLGIL